MHSWRLTILMFGLGPALAACVSTMVVCPAVGCAPRVDVDISSLAANSNPFGATATLCAEGVCHKMKVTLGRGARDPGLGVDLADDPWRRSALPVSVPVTLKVTRGSRVLADVSTRAPLTQDARNGVGCGICYGAQLVLTGDTLTPSTIPPASS